MKTVKLMIMATAAISLLVAPAAMANPGKGKGNGKAAQQHEYREDRRDDARTDAVIDRVFSNVERAIVAEYFGEQWKIANRTGNLPPGLAKRDSLPPGLQKQLIRNGKLPPGLAKRDVPNDLLKRLGPAPKGTQRYLVGSDMILVDVATNVLLDTIKGALYPPRNDIRWNN